MATWSDMREIAARFDSTGACGHEIKRGERILYGKGKAYCPACSRKWAMEVAEENAWSQSYGSM